MDSGFASTMMTAIDTLSSGFSSFTGSTIAGGVWEGQAADNAKNQVSEKIDTKIEAAKEKLQNLISAIEEGNLAVTAKENIAEAEKCISEVNSSNASAEEKKSKIESLETDKKKFEEEYKEHVEKVKSLCSK